MVEATPKAQTAPSVEHPPKEKVALASKGLNFSTAKDKAPATEERMMEPPTRPLFLQEKTELVKLESFKQ